MVFILLQWINIIIATVALIPATMLLSHYRRSRLVDYLLFAAFFICSSITLVATVMARNTNLLIFFKIHNIAYSTSFFALFLHALRLRWDRSPSLLKNFGIVWYSILVFLTLFWELQEQPERTRVMFITLTHNYSSYYPLGAGLVTQSGVTIYSSGHALLGLLFYLFTLLTLIYAYSTFRIAHRDRRTIRAKRLWLIAWVTFGTWNILVLPWFQHLFSLPNALLVLTISIISYVVITIPEAALISHAQIIRAINLHAVVDKINATRHTIFSLDALVDYIDTLPKELTSRKR